MPRLHPIYLALGPSIKDVGSLEGGRGVQIADMGRCEGGRGSKKAKNCRRLLWTAPKSLFSSTKIKSNQKSELLVNFFGKNLH